MLLNSKPLSLSVIGRPNIVPKDIFKLGSFILSSDIAVARGCYVILIIFVSRLNILYSLSFYGFWRRKKIRNIIPGRRVYKLKSMGAFLHHFHIVPHPSSPPNSNDLFWGSSLACHQSLRRYGHAFNYGVLASERLKVNHREMEQ